MKFTLSLELVMTTQPLALAMIAMSLTAATATASPNADLDNSGNVDSMDLVAIASQLNQLCNGDCPTDLNNDGVTDTSDILVLMQNWGPVPGWVAPDPSPSNAFETSSGPFAGRDMSWQGQGPVLYDAIYYDQLSRNAQRRAVGEELNEGEFVHSWRESNDVSGQYMVYNGAVDWYEDGEYDDVDKAKFVEWLDENVPVDYDGPICLDMEGQWWTMWHTESQEVMDTIIDFYVEGLEYAQSKRPNAKIGYWGLPKQRHTNPNSTTASVVRLLEASTALFPDVYEWNPGSDDSMRLERHIRNTMEMVEGNVPVFVQASPRFKYPDHQRVGLHTVEEFMHDQIDAALAAVWTDDNGKEHRISGISIWDAYAYFWLYTDNWTTLDNETRKELCNELDSYHVELLSSMKESVDVAYSTAQALLGESTPRHFAQVVDEEADAPTLSEPQKTSSHNSQFVRHIRVAQVPKVSTNRTYQSSSRSYRTARTKWSTAKNNYSSAKRMFSKDSEQYNSALEEYLEAQDELRESAEDYRSERSTYRAIRASWNTSTNQQQSDQFDEEDQESEEQVAFLTN
jgi:hypothetical protein